MAFGTHRLEVKLGLVRKNYEFGFGPIEFERLAGCPQGHVQLTAGNTSLMVEAHNLRNCLCF